MLLEPSNAIIDYNISKIFLVRGMHFMKKDRN